MKYFTIAELCKSATADKYAIANVPSKHDEHRLEMLVDYILDPLREAFGKPIHVNSGYRCEELNCHPAVGGSKTSDHMYGQAADLCVYKRDENGKLVLNGGKKVVDKAGNQRLFELCISLGLPYKQLIDEYGFSWVHVSYQAGSKKHEIKHIK